MSVFRVVSRLDKGSEGNKCPRCLDGWVDFMEIDAEKGLLGCYKCGCVFVNKAVRTGDMAGKKEQLARQASEKVQKPVAVEAEDAEGGAFVCEVCGRTFDRKIALVGHMRTHKQ